MTLPQDIFEQGSMLANPGKEPDTLIGPMVDSGKYTFDVKWDGVRSFAFVSDSSVRLINRNGRDITFRYPELVAHLAIQFAGTDVVLDGEIMAFGDDGRPDFNRIAKRDAQTNEATCLQLSRTMPATFMVFDVLYLLGQDLRRTPLRDRLVVLDSVAEGFFGETLRLVKSQCSTDGHAMWGFIKEHRMEGLIAKDLNSVYRAKRAATWIKLKPVSSISCLVVGWEEGKGARAGKIGALLLGLHDGTTVPVRCGKVGTGFTAKTLDSTMQRIKEGIPFVVEVEFQEVTPDRQLRFPSFKGIRTDVAITDCTVDQLDRT